MVAEPTVLEPILHIPRPTPTGAPYRLMSAALRRPRLLIPTKDAVLSFILAPPEKSQCHLSASGLEHPVLNELRLPQRVRGEERGFEASTVICMSGHSKHQDCCWEGRVEIQRAQPNSFGHSDLSPAMGGAQQLIPQCITVHCDWEKGWERTEDHTDSWEGR